MNKILEIKEQLNSSTKRITYLVVSALVEFSDYLLLFIFPVIVFDKLKSFWLTAAMLVFWPLGKGLAYLLMQKVIKRSDSRFQYLFGFSLVFLMIIIINRIFTVYTLPLVLLLWGMGLESVRMSISAIRAKYFSEFIGSWDFLYKPVQAFVILLAPIFALAIYSDMDSVTIFNFFGFIMSVSALLFFLRLNRNEAQEVDQSTALSLPSIDSINKSVLFVNLLAGIIWFQLPLQIVINSKSSPLWFSLLPLYLLPFFLLAVFKNVIKVSIWQLQSQVKIISLGVILILGFFAADVLILAVLLFLVGIVSAFILLADQHERMAAELNSNFMLSFILGFLLATLFNIVLGSFLTTQMQFFVLGVIALAYGLIDYLLHRLRYDKLSV